MKVTLLAKILAALSVGSAIPQPSISAAELPQVETRVLPRSRPDRLYQLKIQLPASFREHPERKYPVIFVTDSYWCFQTASNVCGALTYGKHLPEVLVVGLDYAGENLDYGRLREDDLNPMGDVGFEGGHAENFLRVLETQAIPLLELEFRADPAHRYIAGSSGGGNFVLYTLFMRPELFQGYVADSPTTYPLWNLEREFAEAGRSTSARVFISVAENEWTAYRREIQVFYRRMAAHGYVKGGLQFRRIDGVRHGVGGSESFLKGMLFVAEPIAPEHGVQTDFRSDPQGRPGFVVVFRPTVGGRLANFTPAQVEGWEAHEAYLKRLVAAKRVEFAALSPPDVTGHDSAFPFFAEDRAAAEALVRDDPAVKSGVLSYELIEATE